MKFRKKVTSLLLSMVIITGLLLSKDSYVHAISNDLVEVDTENLNSLIITTALDWANMIEPNLTFSVGDIKEIKTYDSGVTEYTASVFYKTIPYGYVVVGFQDNNITVKEATIAPNHEGIYVKLVDEIDKKTDESRKDISVDKTIRKTGPMTYTLGYGDKKGKRHIIDSYGNDVSNDEHFVMSTKYQYSDDIYIYKNNWTSSKYKVNESSKVILKKFTERPNLLSEGYIEKVTGKYACSITALLQIAYMEHLTIYGDADVKKVYNDLWSICKIKTSEIVDGITIGYGDFNASKVGFLKYAIKNGYPGTFDYGIQYSPSTTWIKNHLSSNHPILLGYEIKTNKGISAHAISVLGYMKAKKVSSGVTSDYIMVYNGWDSSVSYINYSTVDFVDSYASYIILQK